MSDLEIMKELLLIQRRLNRLYRKVSKRAMDEQRAKDAELDARREAALAKIRAIQEKEPERLAIIAAAQEALITQARQLMEQANKDSDGKAQ